MLKLITCICLDMQTPTIYITHSSNTDGKINEPSISDTNQRLKFCVCVCKPASLHLYTWVDTKSSQVHQSEHIASLITYYECTSNLLHNTGFWTLMEKHKQKSDEGQESNQHLSSWKQRTFPPHFDSKLCIPRELHVCHSWRQSATNNDYTVQPYTAVKKKFSFSVCVFLKVIFFNYTQFGILIQFYCHKGTQTYDWYIFSVWGGAALDRINVKYKKLTDMQLNLHGNNITAGWTVWYIWWRKYDFVTSSAAADLLKTTDFTSMGWIPLTVWCFFFRQVVNGESCFRYCTVCSSCLFFFAHKVSVYLLTKIMFQQNKKTLDLQVKSHQKYVGNVWYKLWNYHRTPHLI